MALINYGFTSKFSHFGGGKIIMFAQKKGVADIEISWLREKSS